MNAHTPADIARAMGAYIREHGFSQNYNEALTGLPECGCFIHALHAVAPESGIRWQVLTAIENVIGGTVDSRNLKRHGWTKGYTADAAAACDIAADLLS